MEKKVSQLRRKALCRKRKVIFDNDGGDTARLCRGESGQDLIAARAEPAIESGIDTYIYITGWGFGNRRQDRQKRVSRFIS